jgi:plasmid maintenance system antidote protein VapI
MLIVNAFFGLSQIIKGERSITAETALKLGKFFNVPAEFWMNLQSLYDIEEAQKQYRKELKSIHSIQELKSAKAFAGFS